MTLKSNKPFYATSNFNPVLDYNKNEKVTKVLNLTSEYGLVSLIHKPTRVTETTVIDHIANSLLHRTKMFK